MNEPGKSGFRSKASKASKKGKKDAEVRASTGAASHLIQ